MVGQGNAFKYLDRPAFSSVDLSELGFGTNPSGAALMEMTFVHVGVL